MYIIAKHRWHVWCRHLAAWCDVVAGRSCRAGGQSRPGAPHGRGWTETRGCTGVMEAAAAAPRPRSAMRTLGEAWLGTGARARGSDQCLVTWWPLPMYPAPGPPLVTPGWSRSRRPACGCPAPTPTPGPGTQTEVTMWSPSGRTAAGPREVTSTARGRAPGGPRGAAASTIFHRRKHSGEDLKMPSGLL